MISAERKQAAPGAATLIIPPYLETIPRDEVNLDRTRAVGLGGTDIAAILGVSRFKTPFEVWAKKTGQAVSTTMSEEAEAGIYMEPFLLGRYQRVTGTRVVAPQVMFRDRREPWVIANPDGLFMTADERLAGVDAKTRSPFKRGEWGEAGSGNVPPDEWCQAQWYIEVFGSPWWHLWVSFDRRSELFLVPRDAAWGREARAFAAKWWQRHIIEGEMPTPITGGAAADVLRARFPDARNPLRGATEEEEALARNYAAARDRYNAASAALEAAENALKFAIGDSEGLRGAGWSVSWRSAAGRTTTDREAVLRILLSTHPELSDEIERLIAEQTSQAPSTRRFKPSAVFEPLA